ncbi:MAG: hypothetical protein AAB366_03225 [Patescibacteria group bacterium]
MTFKEQIKRYREEREKEYEIDKKYQLFALILIVTTVIFVAVVLLIAPNCKY